MTRNVVRLPICSLALSTSWWGGFRHSGSVLPRTPGRSGRTPGKASDVGAQRRPLPFPERRLQPLCVVHLPLGSQTIPRRFPRLRPQLADEPDERGGRTFAARDAMESPPALDGPQRRPQPAAARSLRKRDDRRHWGHPPVAGSDDVLSRSPRLLRAHGRIHYPDPPVDREIRRLLRQIHRRRLRGLFQRDHLQDQQGQSHRVFFVVRLRRTGLQPPALQGLVEQPAQAARGKHRTRYRGRRSSTT